MKLFATQSAPMAAHPIRAADANFGRMKNAGSQAGTGRAAVQPAAS
jgi:hypothetical protein